MRVLHVRRWIPEIHKPYLASFRAFLASRTVFLNRRIASSTSCSPKRLNDARTYGDLEPFGRNTVPGKANTPLAKACVSIRVRESSSSSSSPVSVAVGGSMSNLNLMRVRISLSSKVSTHQKNNPEAGEFHSASRPSLSASSCGVPSHLSSSLSKTSLLCL